MMLLNNITVFKTRISEARVKQMQISAPRQLYYQTVPYNLIQKINTRAQLHVYSFESLGKG